MTSSVMGADLLERAIRERNATNQPALAAFITGGFPSLDDFKTLLPIVSAAVDIVEVGIPFSDPMADGATIQRSSQTALGAGVTTDLIIQCLRDTLTGTPTVVMSYLNPLLAYGLERLASALTDVAVAGVIIPDLPLEECAGFRGTLNAAGIALIQMVSPATPTDRLRKISRLGQGFLYAVTRAGTTGGSVQNLESTHSYLDKVRKMTDIPVLAGFGIRSADQVSSIAGHCDGVIVGSALLEAIERGEDPAMFLDGLRSVPLEGRTT